MKKLVIKISFGMILLVSLSVFALTPGLRNAAKEAGQIFFKMLQEFVKRDVVGIV